MAKHSAEMSSVADDEGRTKLVSGTDAQVMHIDPGMKIVDCTKLIRLGFLRKVYGILTIQLLATALVTACAMKMTGQYINGYEVLSLGSFIVGSTALSVFIFIIGFILLFALFFFKEKYPTNYILLAAWTFAMSICVAASCVRFLCDPIVSTQSSPGIPLSLALEANQSPSLYAGGIFCAVGTEAEKSGTNSVLMALAITSTLFLGLTVFTFQSKWDFSYLGAGLSAALSILILWGFGMMVFGTTSIMRYLYSLAGTVIFSLYIIFDTWQISQKYGPDDYIIAAIDLYLDVINLFLYILSLMRGRD